MEQTLEERGMSASHDEQLCAYPSSWSGRESITGTIGHLMWRSARAPYS